MMLEPNNYKLCWARAWKSSFHAQPYKSETRASTVARVSLNNKMR